MDKRYQVFVSSTYEDLKEERKEVIQALLELDCIPAGMELFPASNEEQWSLIKRVIDNSDYYLLIIGGRYGSMNEEGKSYTHMEYEYATSIGKPTIAFLPQYPDKIPSGKCETTKSSQKKLENFKKLISHGRMVKFWVDPINLGSLVSRSIIMLIKNFPAKGWVRAETITNEQILNELFLLQKENKKLQKEIECYTTTSPIGSEQLQQGNDLFEIDCFYYYNNETIKHSIKLKFTWNQIFYQISPYLIAPCHDILFKAAFDPLITNAISESNRLFNKELISAFISDTSFNQIKVQLRSLGLINIYSDLSSTKKTEEYWKLTKYGDNEMTKLLAIKK